MHRRDRRHCTGLKVVGRGHHRGRDARRDRLSPKAAPCGSALLEGLPVTMRIETTSTSERLRLSPGAERMLAGFRAVGARDAARLRRIHLFHLAPAGRLGPGFHRIERAGRPRRPADGPGGTVPIVDAEAKAAASLRHQPSASARLPTAWCWRSATVRTTCRSCARADILDRIPRQASSSARARDARDRPLRPRRRAEPVSLCEPCFRHR